MDAADVRYYTDLEAQFVRDHVPAVVRDAIRQYQPPLGFRIARKKKANTSIAYSWGVRLVEENNPGQYWWVCRASDDCRDPEREQPMPIMFNMKNGKTSKVTEHLKLIHGINSFKTETTEKTKQSREDLLKKYEASDLYRQNPGRMMVLCETMKIVRNSLPFCSVEKHEAIMVRKLCYKDAVQATLNAKIVVKSILELYVSCKREVLNLINQARGQRGSYFSIVTDFWTSEVQNKKYLGIRLYMVDATYTFRSVLLGTRQFDPPFGDRDRSCKSCRQADIDPCPHSKHKIRYPYRRWINNILHDFKIKRCDLFGSTSDAGSDVKWMMSKGFKLRWEWCIAHLSNAATKAGCGLVDDVAKSSNARMTNLHKKITLTIFQTKHVSVMGSLFEELCGALSTDQSKQLINYRAHRFIGLTRVVERILLKWDVVVAWYVARDAKASREGTNPPGFPLEGHKRDLIQLLSLLKPIATNNMLAQAEAAVQVDVLLGLFKLKLKTLNPSAPLYDWRSSPPPELPRFFQVYELTPMIKTTRQLLCDAFHVRFFRRYTDKKAIQKCAYIFEMQLALHPDFKDFNKSLKPVVILSNEQYGPIDGDHERIYDAIVRIIDTKLLEAMKAFARPPAAAPNSPPPRRAHPHDENLAMFGHAPQTQTRAREQEDNTNQLLAELHSWRAEATALERDDNGIAESVTKYWGRQALRPNSQYNILPSLARALFAVPSSSAQLERDFGMSGRQVTPERGRTGSSNVDMCAFLNCNHEFIDLTRCPAILERDRAENTPSCVPVPGNPLDEEEEEEEFNFASLPPQIFSNTSLYDGQDSDESQEDEEYLDDNE